MKKIITLLAFICCTTVANAQLGGILDKAKTAAGAAGFDVNKLSSSIVSTLTSKLKLSSAQIPKVTSAVTTFMQAKSQILPLLKTNKTEYTQKQTGLFSNLKTSLVTTLAKDQMNKFLGLKPATNDPANALSSLFY
ncbi:MAG: hypothetical protein C0459_14800 [Chitinophaga sp.]|jgi:hypothetical protein|nr:hypothetical protein [Chitinophaga sp.]